MSSPFSATRRPTNNTFNGPVGAVRVGHIDADGKTLACDVAIRDGDGQLWPLFDLTSDPLLVMLDLADPFKASAEGVRLYLASSGPGLATLTGVACSSCTASAGAMPTR